MENFKLLGRKKFQSGPKQVVPGDTLRITWTDVYGTTELMRHEIQQGEGGTYDEVAVFEAAIDGRKVLGGFIIEQQNNATDHSRTSHREAGWEVK